MVLKYHNFVILKQRNIRTQRKKLRSYELIFNVLILQTLIHKNALLMNIINCFENINLYPSVFIV